jgi:hypothetical protein
LRRELRRVEVSRVSRVSNDKEQAKEDRSDDYQEDALFVSARLLRQR